MTEADLNRIHQFALQENLALAQLDQHALIDEFIEQMNQGLNKPAGSKKSLAMLPSHLHLPTNIPLDTPVVAIDAGGSFLKVALLEFKKDLQGRIRPQLSCQNTFDMPGKFHPVNREEFFDYFYRCIEPLLDKSSKIGLCFSYPCEISATKDGKLLRWTKEIEAPEVEGLWIGENLNQALKKRQHDEKKIILLNDTVATLLAGAVQAGNQEVISDSHISLILGTGSNAACWSSQKAAGSIINIESGAFDGCKNTATDIALDALCSDPGAYPFEKKIAGRYLGNLCLLVLKKAATQDLFSSACGQAIIKLEQLETAALNELLDETTAGSLLPGSEADKKKIKALVDVVLERAAMLTAIQLCAVARQTGGGKQAGHSVAITIDGSTYYQLKTYQEKINGKLASLMRHYEIEYRIFSVKDAPLVGAGLAALSG